MERVTKGSESGDSHKPDDALNFEQDQAARLLSAEGWAAKQPGDKAGVIKTPAQNQSTEYAVAIEKGKPFAGKDDVLWRDTLDKWTALNSKDGTADPGKLGALPVLSTRSIL